MRVDEPKPEVNMPQPSEVTRNSAAVGTCVGLGCAGFIHGLLPAGGIWLRALETSAAGLAAGLLVTWLVMRLWYRSATKGSGSE